MMLISCGINLVVAGIHAWEVDVLVPVGQASYLMDRICTLPLSGY
jgi:hypothetical protein